MPILHIGGHSFYFFMIFYDFSNTKFIMMIINRNPLDLQSTFTLRISLLEIVLFILMDPKRSRGGITIIFTLWMAMIKRFSLQYLFLGEIMLDTT